MNKKKNLTIEEIFDLAAKNQQKNNFQVAENFYNEVLKINPNHFKSIYGLATLFAQTKKFDLAKTLFNKVVQIQPNNAMAYNNLGNIFFETGQNQEAINCYEKAIQILPNYLTAHFNMGHVLNELGKFQEAISSYEKAIQIQPNNAMVYNNLGNTFYELGELQKAISSYEKAIQNQPNNTMAWVNISFPLQANKLQTKPEENYMPLLNENVNTKYDQVTKSILSYSLNQRSLSADSSLDNVLNVLSSVDNIFIKNPKIPADESITEPLLPKKITAMVHFGRSGTGLLHSLIDGHPEVSTLPSIYFSEFFDNFSWEKIIAGGWEEMADRFVSIYAVLFDASSDVKIFTKGKRLIDNIGREEGMMNVGKGGNEILSVNKKVFIEELKRLMDCYNHLNTASFFKLVHSAYEKALNDNNEKKLIFYHIHNPDTYALLNFFKLEPNTNWLMMVREPLQSCESWLLKSFRDNNYKNIVIKIFQMLFDIDQAIYRNDNSIGVRLEDLKEYPKETIKALCSWLGIKENNCLYQMTAQGKKWWGDPSSPDFTKEGMSPFDKTSINRKLGSVFSKKDQFILRTLFYPFRVRFGYAEENLEQFKNDLLAIRPMLDRMFDFEKKIVLNKKINKEKFMKSGPYLFLRSGMIERWNTLNKLHTYPNMLNPLKII
tara:strand:- start:73 stop:2052 length:1980 start_codon:yes stop_codon:yes gene_type:complete